MAGCFYGSPMPMILVYYVEYKDILKIELSKRCVMTDLFLVVDDNQPTRALIGEFLKTLGQSYEEAENGGEAIKLIQSRSFEGIFLDILMPEGDGFEVLNWMVKNNAILPTVVFTEAKARFDMDFPSMAEGLGALKAFDKPVTLEKTRTALEAMKTFRQS